MADEIVAEPTPSPAGGGEPQKTTPSPSPTPAPAPDTSGWEREKAGLLNDLKKERQARQRFEQGQTQTAAELAIERRRVAAALGVTPQSADEVEAEGIRGRFKSVVRREDLLEHLGLSEEDIESIKASKDKLSQVERLEAQQWERHGREMLGSFERELATELGGEKLSERQTKRLISSFIAACTEDPDLRQRYEAGDQKVVTEFVKEWVEDWFKPAQRRAAADNVNRFRPVPGGKDRNIATPAGKKIDVNDKNAVNDLLVAGFRERGGRFRSEQ